MPLQHGVNAGAANEHRKIGLFHSAGAADRASVSFALSVIMQPYIAVERRWRRDAGTAMDLSLSMGSRRESTAWRAGRTPAGSAANCRARGEAESRLARVPAIVGSQFEDAGRRLLAHGDAVDLCFAGPRKSAEIIGILLIECAA